MKTTFLIMCLLIAGAAAAGHAQTKRSAKNKKQTAQKTENLIAYEPDAELFKELNAKVKVVAAQNDWARLDRQAPVNNSDDTLAAFVAQYPIETETSVESSDALFDVIVIHRRADDKFFKITGFDDFARPFDRVRWIDADVLEFEQWTNPRSGARFRVNVKTGKLVAAGYVRGN